MAEVDIPIKGTKFDIKNFTGKGFKFRNWSTIDDTDTETEKKDDQLNLSKFSREEQVIIQEVLGKRKNSASNGAKRFLTPEKVLHLYNAAELVKSVANLYREKESSDTGVLNLAKKIGESSGVFYNTTSYFSFPTKTLFERLEKGINLAQVNDKVKELLKNELDRLRKENLELQGAGKAKSTSQPQKQAQRKDTPKEPNLP